MSTPVFRAGEPSEIKYLSPSKKEGSMVSPDLISTGTRLLPVSMTTSTSCPVGQRIFIHHALDAGEKPGGPLDFIQDHAFAESPEKAARVCQGKFPFIRVFEADVIVMLKNHSGKRCFARLAWAGDRNDGKLSGKGN